MVHTRGQQAGALSPANPGSSAAAGNSVAFQATNVASSGFTDDSQLQSLHLSSTPASSGGTAASGRESWKGWHTLAPKWVCLLTQTICFIPGQTRLSPGMSAIHDMV